jgi:L-aspartate oxidase
MGGVATDLDGRASLPGLFAVGECGCNGLHGANRLASNSLAECFVFGHRAALAALDEPAPPAAEPEPPEPGPSPVPSVETRKALWELAGLVRDAAGLERLLSDPFPLARLIASSALAREESRGAHQRSDHPDTDPGLDCGHLLVGGENGGPEWQRWD